MYLAAVREYFKTRMDALGYTEWPDGFNNENIPSTILGQVYHIESGEITPTASSHQVHQFDCPLTVRVYLKGYLNTSEAVDNAYVIAEEILSDILLPANRFSECIKDIVPASIATNPLSGTNDNAVILSVTFNAITFMKF